MTTLADSISETRRRFYSSHRPAVNILTEGIASGATSLTVDDPADSLQAGANIGIGLEVMRVRRVVGQTATVIRGWDGSTAASHTAGDLVDVNPVVSNFGIFREICDELVDLSANGLFRVTSEEFNFNPVRNGYEVTTAGVQDVLDVRYRETGPWRSWPTIEKYRYDETQSTDDFPSGRSITIYEAGYPGNVIHMILACDFVAPTALTDDMSATCGLPTTATDIPALGAAIRLSAGREVMRNFTEHQGQPRRAQEVPAGANLGRVRGLLDLYRRRVMAESQRLRSTYPHKKRH